jgi:pimeloyl-ACP methyl ester carboxylesterase
MPELSARFKTPADETLFRSAYNATLSLWPVPPEPMDIPTRYGCTHINACGPVDAAPLVLLPGQMLSSTSWYLNIADLSQNFRVYALDTIDDYGLSVPEQPFSNAGECAGWLVSVLDALKIERTNVAGLSYGGWLALNLALAAPERVDRLVLMSPAASLLPMRMEFYIRGFLGMTIPLKFLNDSFTQFLFGTPGAVSKFSQLVNQVNLGTKCFRPQKFVIPTIFSDDELRRVSQPTLLLIGDKEVIYDPHKALARAAGLFPNIRTELVPGAGHAMMADRPDLVNRSIVEFLRVREAETLTTNVN